MTVVQLVRKVKPKLTHTPYVNTSAPLIVEFLVIFFYRLFGVFPSRA